MTTTDHESRMSTGFAEFRKQVISGQVFSFAWLSHAGRKGERFPCTREAWADCLMWLAKLANLGDSYAQIVKGIGLPPLYQTHAEATAYIWKQAFVLMGGSAKYDDVVGRSGPEAGRHSDHIREWTIHERVTVLAYLKRATHKMNCVAPGYGWALEQLAKEENCWLPEWK